MNPPKGIDPKVWEMVEALTDDITLARVGPPHLRDFDLKFVMARAIHRAVENERRAIITLIDNMAEYEGTDFGLIEEIRNRSNTTTERNEG